MSGKYEVYGDAAGEWRWRLKAGNGRVVASGEGYKKKSGALSGVRAHKRIATRAKVVILA